MYINDLILFSGSFLVANTFPLRAQGESLTKVDKVMSAMISTLPNCLHLHRTLEPTTMQAVQDLLTRHRPLSCARETSL